VAEAIAVYRGDGSSRSRAGCTVSTSCCCTSQSPWPCCFAWRMLLKQTGHQATEEFRNNLSQQKVLGGWEGGVAVNLRASCRGRVTAPPFPPVGTNTSCTREAPRRHHLSLSFCPLSSVEKASRRKRLLYCNAYRSSPHARCPRAVCRGVIVAGQLSLSADDAVASLMFLAQAWPVAEQRLRSVSSGQAAPNPPKMPGQCPPAPLLGNRQAQLVPYVSLWYNRRCREVDIYLILIYLVQ